MHFGKLVKKVAFSRSLCAEELAGLMGKETRDVLFLYENEQWLSGDIAMASGVLNYNFGRHLDHAQFMQATNNSSEEYNEVQLQIKYPKGKDMLMRIWIHKILLIAKTLGLEVQQ